MAYISIHKVQTFVLITCKKGMPQYNYRSISFCEMSEIRRSKKTKHFAKTVGVDFEALIFYAIEVYIANIYFLVLKMSKI